jgi:hypothetical protein
VPELTTGPDTVRAVVPVDTDWIQISRFDGDRIAETWAQMDMPKMVMQLGLMPAPGEAAPG